MSPCEFCGTLIPYSEGNKGNQPETFYYIVDWGWSNFFSSNVCISCAISNREMSLSPSSKTDVEKFLKE
jgi:hypothetical protein